MENSSQRTFTNGIVETTGDFQPCKVPAGIKDHLPHKMHDVGVLHVSDES